MKFNLKSIFSKFHLRKFSFLLCFLFLFDSNFLSCFSNERPAPNNILANRVVVSINNIPYSQLQIERYINAKETLRDAPQNSATVDQTNWVQAIDAFIMDMSIHQEASKSSGFRPSRETIQKLRFKMEAALQAAPQFKLAFDKLSMGKVEIETEALRIATVENYRRGKSTLVNQSKDTVNAEIDNKPKQLPEKKNSISHWENELKERTIVRYFDDAKTWKLIHPKP